MTTTFPLRTFLGLYSSFIACFSVLIVGEIFKLQYGIDFDVIFQTYNVLDFVIISMCLGFGSLLLGRIYRKENKQIVKISKARKILKFSLTLIVGILFVIPFLIFVYFIYMRIDLEPGSISFAPFVSGFLAGFVLLPRFISSEDHQSKPAIRGAIITGAIGMLCYSFLAALEEYIAFSGWNENIPNLWWHLDFFSSNFLMFVFSYLFSPYSLGSLLLLPLWGFFGWLAHRWLEQRQHHFWPQDLTAFE